MFNGAIVRKEADGILHAGALSNSVGDIPQYVWGVCACTGNLSLKESRHGIYGLVAPVLYNCLIAGSVKRNFLVLKRKSWASCIGRSEY